MFENSFEQPQPLKIGDKKLEDLGVEKPIEKEQKKEVRAEDEEKIEELPKTDKGLESPAKENSNENQEVFRLEKKHCLKFLEAVKGLRNVFSKRNSEGLNTLLDEGYLGRMNAAVSNIEDILSRKEFYKNEFNDEIKKIISSIQKIGDFPKQRAVREDFESLSALNFRLRKIKDDSGDLIRYISKFNPEQTKETRKILHELCNISEKK
ncbi:MAG: hypothetical protein ABIG60_01270, partial [Patescibacteria group bacterium]